MAYGGAASGRSVSWREALTAVQASDVGTLQEALNSKSSLASYRDEARRRMRCH
jgi:archaellum biogenesis protein FlaJ (TadC family)